MNYFFNIFLCLLFVGVFSNVVSGQSSWDYSGLKSPADLVLAQEQFLKKNGLEVDKEFFHDYYKDRLLYFGKEYDFPEYFGKTMDEHLADGVTYPKEDDVFYYERRCLVDSAKSSMSFESLRYKRFEGKERTALFHNYYIGKSENSTSGKDVYVIADNLEWFNDIQLNQEIIDYLKQYHKEEGTVWERELGCTFYFSLNDYESHSKNDFLHVEVYKIEVYPKGYSGEPLLTYVLDKEAVGNSLIKEEYEKKVVDKHVLPYNFIWLDGRWKYSSNDTDYEFSIDNGHLVQKITESPNSQYEKTYLYKRGLYTPTRFRDFLHYPVLSFEVTEGSFGMKEMQLSDITSTRPQSLYADVDRRTLVYNKITSSGWFPVSKVSSSSQKLPVPDKCYHLTFNKEGVVNTDISHYPKNGASGSADE